MKINDVLKITYDRHIIEWNGIYIYIYIANKNKATLLA